MYLIFPTYELHKSPLILPKRKIHKIRSEQSDPITKREKNHNYTPQKPIHFIVCLARKKKFSKIQNILEDFERELFFDRKPQAMKWMERIAYIEFVLRDWNGFCIECLPNKQRKNGRWIIRWLRSDDLLRCRVARLCEVISVYNFFEWLEGTAVACNVDAEWNENWNEHQGWSASGKQKMEMVLWDGRPRRIISLFLVKLFGLLQR